MTIYKAIKSWREPAAEVAVRAAAGRAARDDRLPSTARPSRCSTPFVVTSDNIKADRRLRGLTGLAISAPPAYAQGLRSAAGSSRPRCRHDPPRTPSTGRERERVLRPARDHQALRRRRGADRRRLRRRTRARSSPSSATTAPASRRWSRCWPACTRPTRARSPSRARRSTIAEPGRRAATSASRPSTRTSRCATTSTSSRTSSSAASCTGSGLDEVAMETRSWTLLRELSAKIPSRPDRRRVALRRPAPDRRDRPLAARRPEGDHPRRADRGARRRADRRGAQPDRAPPRARPRRDHDQPQHGRRAGRRRRVVVLRLGRNNGVFKVAGSSIEEIVAAITGASDNVVSRARAAAPPPRRPRRRATHEPARARPLPSPRTVRTSASSARTACAARSGARSTASAPASSARCRWSSASSSSASSSRRSTPVPLQREPRRTSCSRACRPA